MFFYCFQIKNVQEVDRGWYMCQVNTDPMYGYIEIYIEILKY